MRSVTVLAAKRLGITHCSPGALLSAVAEKMASEDVSSLVVIDEEGFLKGVISRTDVVRAALARPNDWREALCCDWMTREVVTIAPEALLEDAALLMQAKHVHRVIVAQQEGDMQRPIAVVSDSDILYHLARRSA